MNDNIYIPYSKKSKLNLGREVLKFIENTTLILVREREGFKNVKDTLILNCEL